MALGALPHSGRAQETGEQSHQHPSRFYPMTSVTAEVKGCLPQTTSLLPALLHVACVTESWGVVVGGLPKAQRIKDSQNSVIVSSSHSQVVANEHPGEWLHFPYWAVPQRL